MERENYKVEVLEIWKLLGKPWEKKKKISVRKYFEDQNILKAVMLYFIWRL